MTNAVGCRRYMPPEFYTGKYNNKLDVFMFGLTLNELFNGAHCLKPNSSDATSRPQVTIAKQGDLFYFIVEKCINKDPDLRPNSAQLEQWFTDFKKTIEDNLPIDYDKFKCEDKNQVLKDIHDRLIAKT